MNLDAIGDRIIARLTEKHQRREELLTSSRQLTQFAAKAIRAIHRGEDDQAVAHLAEAERLLTEMNRTATDHPDLESAGYHLDAQKEYAEAWLTRALIGDEALPPPEELQVEDAAWLNGLGEAGGELRRASLDLIRKGELVEAERLLAWMQEIHAFLSTVDFPSAITRDIKRTNDMVRGVTERTRGDLTFASRQDALQVALRRFETMMKSGSVADQKPTPDSLRNDI